MTGLLGRLAKRDEPDGAGDPEEVTRFLERVASQPYPAESVRPWMLVASRVALWGAVAVGAFGGVAGCLGRGDGQVEVPATDQPDPAIVPAQVASVAEMAVGEWLIATEEDDERLLRMFVEPPDLPRELAARQVRMVRTVTGQLVQPRYWSVTVAADVALGVETEEDGSDDPGTGLGPGEEDSEPEVVTWFVEVGIVGDPTKALAALRTPALMPGPPPVDEGWSYTAEPWNTPEPGDELAATVEGFLAALLAGDGDPGPYLAPGADIPTSDANPLEAVFVDELSIEELDDGRRRVQVRATGVTAADDEQPLAYEIVVLWRNDRYQVLELWGSSTLTEHPPAPSTPQGGPPVSGDGG